MCPRDMFERVVRPFMRKRAIRHFAPYRDSLNYAENLLIRGVSTPRMTFAHELDVPNPLPICPKRPGTLWPLT